MFSIWEKQSYLRSDIVIIGGGILELSTACSIKEQYPERTVLVLEKGILPTGASTKNAGFACFGSLTELVSDMKSMGQSLMLQLVEKRWRGLAMLDQRLGEEAMDFQHFGGFELLMENELDVYQHIDAINQLLFPLFQMEVYHSAPSKIIEFGFNKEVVKDIIFNPFEGQLDTGKMMKALLRVSQSLGVEVITGAEVIGLHSTGSAVEVEVRNGKAPIYFSANKVAVCTNAFLPMLFPEMRVKPGRGQVLITKPIPNLKIKGTLFEGFEGFFQQAMDTCMLEFVFNNNQQTLEEFKALTPALKDSYWINNTKNLKLSLFFENVLSKYSQLSGQPIPMNKGQFYELIQYLPKEQVDAEISNALDLIVEYLTPDNPENSTV